MTQAKLAMGRFALPVTSSSFPVRSPQRRPATNEPALSGRMALFDHYTEQYDLAARRLVRSVVDLSPTHATEPFGEMIECAEAIHQELNLVPAFHLHDVSHWISTALFVKHYLPLHNVPRVMQLFHAANKPLAAGGLGLPARTVTTAPDIYQLRLPYTASEALTARVQPNAACWGSCVESFWMALPLGLAISTLYTDTEPLMPYSVHSRWIEGQRSKGHIFLRLGSDASSPSLDPIQMTRDSAPADYEYSANLWRGGLGEYYFMMSRFWMGHQLRDEAIEALHTTLTLDPQHAEAYIMLSGIARLEGRPQEAVAILEAGLPYAPHYRPLHENLAGARQEIDLVSMF